MAKKTDLPEGPLFPSHAPVQVKNIDDLYSDWFLEYASYVILERAVPHINDGLKPVQRRIMHSLWEKDDGRYNKVANIVGHCMQYHPHGDASIGDALVGLGQKELLIDCQGNWGNILTGDNAAAPRYIEARLSKFAQDVVFAPKVTEWAASYDGRNKEPVTLPMKFPLLLAQGAAPGPIDVLESGMLRPKKSQLAVFALAPAGSASAEPADLVPCKYCALIKCEYRREAHVGSIRSSELGDRSS